MIVTDRRRRIFIPVLRFLIAFLDRELAGRLTPNDYDDLSLKALQRARVRDPEFVPRLGPYREELSVIAEEVVEKHRPAWKYARGPDGFGD